MTTMTRARLLAFCLFLLSGAAATAAAPVVVVDAVAMPAWLDRGARSAALVPGAEVRQGDLIRTGNGARVYLRLPEGSTVKIGANARFALGEQAQADRTLFAAAYDVLAGAFRFTTDKLRRHQPRRDISIKVATATIGIRGTDVWGKTDAEQDLVILIEGKIFVSHASGEVTPMAAERATFIAPRGAKPLPLSRISPEELAQRARETEIEPGDGVSRHGGRVKVRLGRDLDNDAALEIWGSADHAGFAPTIRPHGAAGAWRYDVLLGGFSSRAEAAAAVGRLPAALQAAAAIQ
jgi:hypothetical protein